MKQIAELIEGHPLILADSSDNVRDVARKMSERNIGAIAVLDSGKLVGIFSERDLMTRVVVPGLDPDDTPVSNVMTRRSSRRSRKRRSAARCRRCSRSAADTCRSSTRETSSACCRCAIC